MKTVYKSERDGKYTKITTVVSAGRKTIVEEEVKGSLAQKLVDREGQKAQIQYQRAALDAEEAAVDTDILAIKELLVKEIV